MAKSYADIKKQIEVLQADADALKAKELAGVIDRIKEAISHYGITAQDLGLSEAGKRGRKTSVTKAAGVARKSAAATAKFTDGNGQTWGGRGPRPAWLRNALANGHTLEEFAVGKASRRKASVESAAARSEAGQKPVAKRAKAPSAKAASSIGAAKKVPAKKSTATSRRRTNTSEAAPQDPQVETASAAQAAQDTQG